MKNKKIGTVIIGAAALLTASACHGGNTVPSAAVGAGSAAAPFSPMGALPASDTTSILKNLTKDVIIGSTVDSKNGDQGPRGFSIVKTNYGLKKGYLAICNFADKAGGTGRGTTVELLNPTPGSKPARFVQSTAIKGCSDAVVTNNNGVAATGLLSGKLMLYNNKGKLVKAYGSPFKAPFYDVDASCPTHSSFCGYSAEYIFGSDAATGSIVNFSINNYGNPRETQVATGFAKNKKYGWLALGPSGVQYNPKNDTLYIADGMTNTIVSFNNASELLVTNEIIVKPGGKTFQCKYPHTTCGTLVLAGSPLNAPVAMAILPNGNLIAANSQGNMLVELTPSGTVLDTKVVDTSSKPGVFGLQAKGTNDSNTVLFYTDRNDNNLHELEP